MKNPKDLTVLFLLILVGISGATLQPSFSTDEYTRIFCLETGGSKYNLTLTISESLYNSYLMQRLANAPTLYESEGDKFVTPKVFVQVANQIRSVFTDDEDFANAILMIVQQIPYNEEIPHSGTLRYPVETLGDNSGDCDVLSVLAASLMKAGGLDVVLLEYSNHMNIGVCLPNKQSGTYYNYNGKRFYVAETTGSGWRVGGCPPQYTRAYVISLENCDTNSLGQVTANLTKISSFPPLSLHFIILVFLAITGVVLYKYGFRGARQTSDTPIRNAKPSEDTELPNGVWCICPKCGAHISANIE